MAGVQANSSIGWVGYADGGNGDITSGYEFEVSGSVGMCCKAVRGGNLEWVVPPRCTKDFGLKRSGTGKAREDEKECCTREGEEDMKTLIENRRKHHARG